MADDKTFRLVLIIVIAVVTRKDHTLVTSGPYRYVRHPFYLSFGLGVLGGSLAMANWFILLTGVLPLGFLMARTRIEEAKLIGRFGVEYQEYMRRVGRFLPRFRL
ncbi:MAG: isoprenylcysteine carboxylmethyltransferase family protein [Candidatus Omnitrophica bacterium]|nr:isoprenylcysteine carboxylmethyltransferase family protein [Candidatus Omnitrophota bacterium]